MKQQRIRRLLTALAAALPLTTVLVAGAAAPATAAVPLGSAGTITIGGLCLDDDDFGTADGTIIKVFTCNGSSAQKWTWYDDGTLRIFGKCVDVTGAANATGALIVLYTCSALPHQKFAHLPDGTIYSAKSGKCLAVQGAIANGSRVGLAPCDPAQANQKFTAATAPAAKYALSAGSAVRYSRPDDTPAAVYLDKDGTFYYQQAHALYGADEHRKWSFFTGADFDSTTLAPITNSVNPNNSNDSNADTTWRCNNSPTGLESTYAPAGSSYSQRNYCDLAGVWVDPDTGDWYGLVHNEFTPQPFGDGMHYDSIDYGVSTDQGKTWTIRDHVITSPYSVKRNDTAAFPASTYYYGDGDQRLFVDYASGYFYVFYASRVLNKSGGGAVWLQHVARAPISQKMAPSSWSKWYNGAWQTPGVGGAESNIIPADGGGPGYTTPAEDYKPAATGSVASQVSSGVLPDNSQLAVMNIAWNAYLGLYIGTPQNNVAQATDTKTPLRFYATKDLATQKWFDLGLVVNQPNGAWYRWLLDSANLTSSTVLGKTFRSYCSFYCSTYSGEYATITIAPKSTADLPASPVHSGATYRVGAGNGQFLTQSGSGLATTTANPTAWTFTPTGDGFHSVANRSTGHALGVGGDNAGRAWGAGVSLGAVTCAPTVNQQWSIQATTTGSYRLVNRYSGLALSLSGTVVTAPQRNWVNAGTAGDTRSPSAQTLAFSVVDTAIGNTVTVACPGNQSSPAAAAISPVQIAAVDSDRTQSLTYSASGLPGGLSINTGTGEITGTPTGAGTSSVTVTATDGSGASGSTTFTWVVTPADLARDKPTTASSVEATTLAATQATDGNPSTRWASAYADPQWLRVDLGSTRTITGVGLAWEAAYAKAYQIQVSNDGTSWTTIYSTSTSTGGTQDLAGLTGSGRYVRMLGTTRATSFGYSLWSFNVYGS
ncbi:RICIN domain-containing protein [Actinokineospora xionganensis]|uniref:Discoidin domain-containing protein n=1 Tax=Actinokineospora xionganensis TaxID=2684470 RepID=A0ABR7L0R7_9PSEU|nr:RICIN domain-containing protein [Actinokineospora xionganensis]MBC6446029.1 discoidin domain-containing protein [Actinokineospora xionganensis]